MVHRRVFLGQDDLGSTGFHAGQDTGLMIALNVIVAEQTGQDDAATVAALDPHQHVETARHQYCAGRLLAVGRIVAATFRTVQSD
jgi:hypothetical protein